MDGLSLSKTIKKSQTASDFLKPMEHVGRVYFS